MKPVIGIVCSFDGSNTLNFGKEYNFKEESYIRKVKEAGSIPLLIPVRPSLIDDIPTILKRLDGIILSGGVDIHPSFFNEEPIHGLGYVDYLRDQFEIKIYRECIKEKKPVLGICRGIQLMNIAEGGTLYQDIIEQLPKSIQHTQKTKDPIGNHYINIKEGTYLFNIYKDKKGFVNSFHHQAINNLASTLEVIAWSNDGLVEAVIHKKYRNIIGVQWHPEILEDIESKKIFEYFTNLVKKRI